MVNQIIMEAYDSYMVPPTELELQNQANVQLMRDYVRQLRLCSGWLTHGT